MAIKRVGLIERGREMTQEVSGTRTVRNTYRVVTTEPIEDEVRILAAVDPNDGEAIPSIGEQWVGVDSGPDPLLRVVRQLARQTEDTFVWEVEVEFSTDNPLTNGPLAQPRKVEWGAEQRRVARQRDAYGTPYRNSAGVAFSPPPEDEEDIIVVTVTRNEASFSPDLIRQFSRKVNDAAWNGWDAGTVRCASIRATEEESQGFEYARVTYVFKIDERGWYQDILDNGWEIREGAGYKTIRDNSGDNRKGVPLFDGAGGRLELAKSELSTAITANQNSIPVASVDALIKPDPPCYVEIEDEVILVQDVDLVNSILLDCLRGQQDTQAADHQVDTDVRLAPVFLRFKPFRRANFDALGIAF